MPITADDIKKMSSQTKAFGVIGIFIVIGILYYIYFFGDLLQEKISFATKLEATKTQIKQREQIALQLDKYIAEVEALKQNYKIALNAWKINPRSTKVSHSEMHHGKEFRIEFEGFPDGLAFSRVFGPNGVISSFLHNSPYVHLNELESFVENVKRGRLSTYRKAKSN